SSRRTMALRLGPDLPLVQPCHRRERPYPRTYPGEHNVECVFGVTDDREGREHIPDRAPVRRPVAPPATDRSIEEHIGSVSGGGRGEDAERDKRVDYEIHAAGSLYFCH